MSKKWGQPGFHRKHQVFDVTTTHSLKLLGLNIWSIISATDDLYMNLASLVAEFSVVLMAKKSVFVLQVNSVKQCLNAKVCAINYKFSGKKTTRSKQSKTIPNRKGNSY